MKTLRTLTSCAILTLSFVSVQAQACGGHNGIVDYKGNENALYAVANKSLTCLVNNKEIKASVSVRQVTRCPGSPLVSEIRFANNEYRSVSNVATISRSWAIYTDLSTPILCFENKKPFGN